MPLRIEHCLAPVLSPNKDVPWAETMVCNPGIIKDPNSKRLHMLFRACGPWLEKNTSRLQVSAVYLGSRICAQR